MFLRHLNFYSIESAWIYSLCFPGLFAKTIIKANSSRQLKMNATKCDLPKTREKRRKLSLIWKHLQSAQFIKLQLLLIAITRLNVFIRWVNGCAHLAMAFFSIERVCNEISKMNLIRCTHEVSIMAQRIGRTERVGTVWHRQRKTNRLLLKKWKNRIQWH